MKALDYALQEIIKNASSTSLLLKMNKKRKTIMKMELIIEDLILLR